MFSKLCRAGEWMCELKATSLLLCGSQTDWRNQLSGSDDCPVMLTRVLSPLLLDIESMSLPGGFVWDALVLAFCEVYGESLWGEALGQSSSPFPRATPYSVAKMVAVRLSERSG